MTFSNVYDAEKILYYFFYFCVLMERRTLLKMVGVAAGATALGTPAAEGGERDLEEEEPEPDQRDDLGTELAGIGANDLLTNEELGELLRRVEASENSVSLEVIGESNEGRDIYAATVGTGETSIFAISEQHGHEPFTAEGCVAALDYLASSDHSDVKEIIDNVSLSIVPRVNPDGFAKRQRVNHDPDVPEENPDVGLHTREGGWDPNRYHWYDWKESTLYQSHPDEYPENPVSELRVLLDYIREVDPELVIDYHRQGPHVDSNGDLIDVSLAWPQHPDVSSDAQALSQQLAGLFYQEIPEAIQSNITEFTPAGEYAGTATNAHALADRGSILYEICTATRGGIGYRIQLVAESLLIAAKATADGSLYDVDPTTVEQIPEEWGTTLNL